LFFKNVSIGFHKKLWSQQMLFILPSIWNFNQKNSPFSFFWSNPICIFDQKKVQKSPKEFSFDIFSWIKLKVIKKNKETQKLQCNKWGHFVKAAPKNVDSKWKPQYQISKNPHFLKIWALKGSMKIRRITIHWIHDPSNLRFYRIHDPSNSRSVEFTWFAFFCLEWAIYAVHSSHAFAGENDWI